MASNFEKKITCKQNHQLSIIPGRSAICYNCRANTTNHFACSKCDYDLCNVCLMYYIPNPSENSKEIINITTPVCRSFHKLEKNNTRINATCDSCRMSDSYYFTCLQCDYDLCSMCTYKIFYNAANLLKVIISIYFYLGQTGREKTFSNKSFNKYKPP